MTEYNENVTDEQNAAVEENFEGEYTATDAVNEEFVATIGDSIASEDESEQTCPLIPNCETRPVWLRVRDSIAGALDSITLADLIREERVAGEVPAAAPQVVA